MILQALYQLAQDEQLVRDLDYELKPVAWLVRVGEGGKLLGIEGTHSMLPAEGKRRPREVAKPYRIPRQEGRTSGDRAQFLVDKAEYVFGTDPTGKRPTEKLRQRAALFRDRVRECAEATGDAAMMAVYSLLENVAGGRQQVALPTDEQGRSRCKSNDLFAFVYAPDVETPVTDRDKVRRYWRSLRVKEVQTAAAETRCLVTGKPCLPVKKHPLLKGVPGGTTSGVALVSYNENAFESHGWQGNDNAPISREAAEACATALNRLLDLNPRDPSEPNRSLGRRNIKLSADTVVCYWAPGARDQDFVSCLAGLWQANPESVKGVYQSIWKGRPPLLDDPSAFYALTLTGTQGRAIIRDWFQTTVADVAQNLAAHFADLDIVPNAPKSKDRELPPAVPLDTLLESLAPLGKAKDIPAPMVADVLRSALQNRPYPISFLQKAVERTRAEVGRGEWADLARRDARAALIKAVLNRRKRVHPETTAHYKEVTRTMDPTNTNPGYLLGRLMAAIGRMQQLALGDVGATVVDRFFSGASACPRATFPRLLRNLRHHASKAKDNERAGGTARWLESQVDGILAPLTSFPATLSLEEQGLFVLGYHHERHWLWLSREEREKPAESPGNA